MSSEAVGPIRLNLLGGTKTGEPIRLNLLGGTLKVLTTNLYIYWGQRQGSLGLLAINILAPKIWFHVPHPSNGQNIVKTKPFRRQKRRFLDGARLQEFWLRRAAFTSPRCVDLTTNLYIYWDQQ